MSVHDYLYNKKEDKEATRLRMLRDEDSRKKDKMATSLEASSQIVERIKREKLMELFNQLDSDGDGYISPQNIDIDHISNEVIELIKPILVEMDENNCMVDFEAFYLSTLHLMQTLSIAERDELFHSFKSKWEERKSKVE